MYPVSNPAMLSEQGLLSAEMLVAWKRERGVYDFKTLPTKAIIGIERNIFVPQLNLFSRKLRGLRGANYIKDAFVFCAEFGSGAPAMVTLLEELSVLGVKEFIFVGLAGILSDTIKTGDVFCIDKTLSGSGTTAYYTAESLVTPYDAGFVTNIQSSLTLKAATCFSTDSPFRETPSLIADIKLQGCELIEMECASVYAFSQYYKLKAACLLVAADVLSSVWTPPSGHINLNLLQQQLVSDVIKSSI